MAKLTGKVLYIYPTQQLTSKSGNAFQKRDFVIAVQSFDRDTGEPTIDTENTPQLSLSGDRCSQLDGVTVGQIVSVDFYLRGRRYRGDDGKEKIITDINVTSVRPQTPIFGQSFSGSTPQVQTGHPNANAAAPASVATTAQAIPDTSTPTPPTATPQRANDDLPF